jgi:hypothetical protein
MIMIISTVTPSLQETSPAAVSRPLCGYVLLYIENAFAAVAIDRVVFPKANSDSKYNN